MNEKTVYACADQEHDAWVCGKYHTNYIVCRRCGKLCYRMRRRREKMI